MSHIAQTRGMLTTVALPVYCEFIPFSAVAWFCSCLYLHAVNVRTEHYGNKFTLVTAAWCLFKWTAQQAGHSASLLPDFNMKCGAVVHNDWSPALSPHISLQQVRECHQKNDLRYFKLKLARLPSGLFLTKPPPFHWLD